MNKSFSSVRRAVAGLLVSLPFVVSSGLAQAQQSKVRIAFGDVL